MNMRRLAIILPICLIILTGCTMQTEEEAIQSAKKAAEDKFNTEEIAEANHSLNNFSLYIPSDLEVVEEDVSNVILEDGDQTFIVFYNKLEDPLSKLSYESAKTESDQALVLDTFEDQQKFGYIRILPNEEEDQGAYELQVGVGGAKVTTYTSRRNMASDSEELMKMARSIAMTNDTTSQK